MARRAPAASRLGGGGSAILLATVIAGAIGYVITIVAGRGLGAADYATFSVFWGALYLLVGSLSGIQQEITRASSTGPVGSGGAGTVARFALAAAVAVFLVVLVGGVVAASSSAFGPVGTELVLPLALGLAVNAVVVALSGVVYGLAAWRIVTVVIVLDVVLRLVGVLVALGLDAGVVGLAWASVLPFGLVLAYLMLAARGVLPRATLDVGLGRLALNASRTVGASIGMAVLISGFPLLIGLARRDADDVAVGALVFALILTRAPIVVSVLGLQSFLVVVFRGRSLARLPPVLLAVAAAAGVLALAAWLWGEQVITALAGDEFAIHGDFLAGLVLASAPTACLAITGAAVLARSRHGVYIAGWTIAAATAVLLLFALPGSVESRTLIALAAGPVAGLVLHAIGVALRRAGAAEDPLSETSGA